MEQIRNALLTGSAFILAALMLAALLRAILGPRFTDRIIAVNVINTMVVAELAILSVRLREDFLVDVALVYALLSFLTVVVVSRVVLTWRRRKTEKGRGKGEGLRGA
jgi:multicomponent Na+:H+ antiporter subunit F